MYVMEEHTNTRNSKIFKLGFKREGRLEVDNEISL